MCGIAGIAGRRDGTGVAAVHQMCAAMRRRGPDDGGVEVVGNHGHRSAVLGNRRLAIVDPSPLGHQPMMDPQRGNVITFNGMIFNFRELRTALEQRGERFLSECDTEVILRAYGVFGAECVRLLHGMFGFALWDAKLGRLFVARDRFGIKPVYYGRTNDGLIFASQVRALLASGLISPQVDGEGVASFLRWGATIEPRTCLKGISSLPAGHTMTVTGNDVDIESYWTPPTPSDRAVGRSEVVTELRERLEAVVDMHLVSDAPLGVFLSGGIDSSALAALASQRTSQLRTVSVVFDDALSERVHMVSVAEKIRTQQTFVDLDATILLQWSQEAIQAMDQPSVDGVNTFVVSRVANDLRLKVALSGLGADELLNGYGHARMLRRLESAASLPAVVRRAGALGLSTSSRPRARKTASWLRNPEDRFGAYAQIRRLHDESVVSRVLVHPPEERETLEGDHDQRPTLNALSVYDMSYYMRNTLLRDTDALSMANSLEVRVPFLDDGFAEWILRLPDEVKGGQPKGLLIDAMGDLLPASVLGRRKHGFTLPFGRWLAGPMREAVTTRLKEPVPALDGIVSPDAAEQVWHDFLRGRTTWHRAWALNVLYSWAATL